MKAPFHIVERIAADIFSRGIVSGSFPYGLDKEGREVAREVAVFAFEVAEIFGEESERRWAARDTERAKKALEEAARK